MSDDRRRHESSRRRSRSRSPQGRYRERDRAGDRDRDRRSHYKNDRRDPNDSSGSRGYDRNNHGHDKCRRRDDDYIHHNRDRDRTNDRIHHRSHSNDSRELTRRHRDDTNSSYKANQNDDRRNRYEDHQKLQRPSPSNCQHRRTTSTTSSHGSSPYSTPPPPPSKHPPNLNHVVSQTSIQNTYSNFKESNNKYEKPRETLKQTKSTDPRKTLMSQNHKIQKIEEKKQNFKVLIDPTIKKGHTKVVRYDGVLTGQTPVAPKDPRRPKSKVWSIEVADLPLPRLKHDKNYVGPMPLDTIRFANLNDNVDRKFLHELCEAYGDIKEYKVYCDPKTNAHLGTGKVVFDEGTDVTNVATALNGRQVMGKIVTAYVEIKNPPGHAMMKQLEEECRKSRLLVLNEVNHLRSSLQSVPQPTPSTPNISSMNRLHPVAGETLQNYRDMTRFNQPNTLLINNAALNADPPPPPPPKIGNIQSQSKSRSTPPPPPRLKFEDISPTATEFDKRFWLNHNDKKNSSNEQIKKNKQGHANIAKSLMRVAGYSPVSNSDRSASPISPSVREEKTKYSKFEPVSDNEQAAIEDISPVQSPTQKAIQDDDDAMSLSSISSNGDNKVELNIQSNNLSLSNSLNLVNNNMNSTMNNRLHNQVPPNQSNILPPSSIYPRLPYVLNQYQQQSPQQPNVLLNSPMPDRQNMVPNLQNSSNFNPSTQPPWPDRHTEIIKNALQSFNVNNSTFQPPVPVDIKNLQFNSTTMQQHHPSQLNLDSSSTPTYVPENSSQIPLPQDVPLLSPEQQIEFQVKTGCARDLSQELKRVLVKDTLKKLIEQTAFMSFESWWQSQLNTETKLYSKIPNKNEKLDNRIYKTLSDKSNIDANLSIKPEAPLTTSALLKTLFGHERNDENHPPQANFLNSFRISRKPQIQSSLKGNHISHKRKPWPSFYNKKLKHQRIEDSEDEDEEISDMDEDKKDAEEEQFEEFALRHRHRQSRQSGSSLYQHRVYSEESESDEKPESEDESSSSSSSEDESSTAESETTESESETEEEIIEDDKVDVTTQDEISKKGNEIKSNEKVENEPDKTENKTVSFVSMYDERRRRAAVLKVEAEREKQQQEQQKRIKQRPKSKPKSVTKRTRRVPRVFESSEDESVDESEPTEITPDEENITIDETKKDKETDQEINKEKTLLGLIMKEHNYFSSLPKPSVKAKSKRKVLHEKQMNEQTVSEEEYVDIGKIAQFSQRSNSQESDILSELYKQGLDSEDYSFMKLAYERLKGRGAKEINEFVWLDHPISSDISPLKQKRHKGESKLRVHNTGSARSEGYYKIPMLEKATYLKSALRHLQAKKETDVVQGNEPGTVHKVKSRENRAMQRRLASSIAQEEFGSLLNYNNQLKIRKKALRFAKSSIHNWGLFACEPIAAEEMVCEYVGQMVRAVVAELREKRYEKMGIGSSYLFRLDNESVIDATKHGCNARFINHCCDPNCYAKVILVEGAKKIVIYSRRQIEINEEITYDYKFPIEDEKIPCLCGAATCRGSLN